jgi:hypothetical protein
MEIQMGEASRRGTFEDRKAKAVTKKKLMVRETLRELESPDPELSVEEKSKRSHARIAMLSFAAMLGRTGITAKEGKRRLKRLQKKRTKTVDR